MPYITTGNKHELYQRDPETSGELNFLITELIQSYYKKRGINYQRINDILGALEGAKLEFYRRVVSKYENAKIRENGDVYE